MIELRWVGRELEYRIRVPDGLKADEWCGFSKAKSLWGPWVQVSTFDVLAQEAEQVEDAFAKGYEQPPPWATDALGFKIKSNWFLMHYAEHLTEEFCRWWTPNLGSPPSESETDVFNDYYTDMAKALRAWNAALRHQE